VARISLRTTARAGAALLLAGTLVACGAVTQQPAVSAPTVAVAPTAEPTVAPTVAPTAVPTPEPTPEPRPALFSASELPIQIQYPADWAPVDFGERLAEDHVGLPEQSMEIVSPDGDARLIIRYYDYKEPGSGDVTGAYVAIQFNESIDRTTVSETSDAEGNMDAEWTYADAGSGEPMHAILRFIHSEGSPYTYALLFEAPEERFAELAPAGQAMIDSFQER
jgi:hypothetical protein